MGCEPTGHYWFNLARYLKEQQINQALVNPYHVKQIKKLDDNSPRGVHRSEYNLGYLRITPEIIEAALDILPFEDWIIGNLWGRSQRTETG